MRGRLIRRGRVIAVVAAASMALVVPVGAKDAFERRIRRAAEATVDAGTARGPSASSSTPAPCPASSPPTASSRSRATVDCSSSTSASSRGRPRRPAADRRRRHLRRLRIPPRCDRQTELLGKRWISVDTSSLYRPRRGEPSEHRSHRWGEPHVAGGCAARHRRRRARRHRGHRRGPDHALPWCAPPRLSLGSTSTRCPTSSATRSRQAWSRCSTVIGSCLSTAGSTPGAGLRRMQRRIDVEDPEPGRVAVTLTMPSSTCRSRWPAPACRGDHRLRRVPAAPRPVTW